MTYSPQKASADLFQTLAELRAYEATLRKRKLAHQKRMKADHKRLKT